jgi:hypothetical protein
MSKMRMRMSLLVVIGIILASTIGVGSAWAELTVNIIVPDTDPYAAELGSGIKFEAVVMPGSGTLER